MHIWLDDVRDPTKQVIQEKFGARGRFRKVSKVFKRLKRQGQTMSDKENKIPSVFGMKLVPVNGGQEVGIIITEIFGYLNTNGDVQLSLDPPYNWDLGTFYEQEIAEIEGNLCILNENPQSNFFDKEVLESSLDNYRVLLEQHKHGNSLFKDSPHHIMETGSVLSEGSPIIQEDVKIKIVPLFPEQDLDSDGDDVSVEPEDRRVKVSGSIDFINHWSLNFECLDSEVETLVAEELQRAHGVYGYQYDSVADDEYVVTYLDAKPKVEKKPSDVILILTKTTDLLGSDVFSVVGSYKSIKSLQEALEKQKKFYSELAGGYEVLNSTLDKLYSHNQGTLEDLYYYNCGATWKESWTIVHNRCVTWTVSIQKSE